MRYFILFICLSSAYMHAGDQIRVYHMSPREVTMRHAIVRNPRLIHIVGQPIVPYKFESGPKCAISTGEQSIPEAACSTSQFGHAVFRSKDCD